MQSLSTESYALPHPQVQSHPVPISVVADPKTFLPRSNYIPSYISTHRNVTHRTKAYFQ